MGKDLTGYNFSEDIEANSGSDPLPAGLHKVKIDTIDIKGTKDNSGEYWNVMFRVLEGEPHGNRCFFQKYNTVNKSKEAEDIGLGQLCALMEASIDLHISKVANTDWVLGEDLIVKVKIEKDEQYGDRNVITSYKKMPNKDFASLKASLLNQSESVAPEAKQAVQEKAFGESDNTPPNL